MEGIAWGLRTIVSVKLGPHKETTGGVCAMGVHEVD